mgnify:FL=1
MNKWIKTSLIIFLTLVIVILAGFFLLDFECSTINILALCFLELSLLVSMFSTISLARRKNDKDTLYYNAGVGSITVIYQIAVIISVVLSKIFEENIKGFIFLQIVINALIFVICTLIITVSTYINNSNKKTLEKQENGEYNKPRRGGF